MQVTYNKIESDVPIPTWWNSDWEHINRELLERVSIGETRLLSVSPGGRPVYAVHYGTAEPELRGTANYNSALGANNPQAYYNRNQRRHPVLMMIGGIHGHEVEGMIGALSIVRILETGLDLTGTLQPELADMLKQLRIIVVPLANPDGRARVPYQGWCGLPQDEMTRWGQGTRKDGDLYRWRPCKEIHPMRGDVGLLGAYFDDNGVNMMHDDWADPMSETTKALLRLAADEGPDCLINLHSYSISPGVLPTAHVPQLEKRRINDFTQIFYERLTRRGYKSALLPDELETALAERARPALNLQSMLYHVGADLPILFESPHGVVGATAAVFDYDEILDVHHELFHTAAEQLLIRNQKGIET
ncbi:hypothetical protein PAESOLCIP111_05493 [Paenibacillus solanacearum]|uniref:Peptidase M14 domain-containing protein n=1 Tax=Paenibacillus solanacearum TaxID=2048548 RepID=A0A916NS78_9BACL|nr:M14 family zinc carboxypeptidase [Paenibacillus solanacearum]CAG7647956.1 hypothetical protein PAESOLCIP111_05493 [Paenibacillus solanacearum]